MTRRKLWGMLTGLIFTGCKLGKPELMTGDSKYIQSIRDKCNLEKAQDGEFDTPYTHCLPKNYTARLRLDIISALLFDEAKERYDVGIDEDQIYANFTRERPNNKDWIFCYERANESDYNSCFVKFMYLKLSKKENTAHNILKTVGISDMIA